MLHTLTSGFVRDSRKYSLLVAAQRGLRKARGFMQSDDLAQLKDSVAFQAHVRSDPEHDPLFFLSNRHYLARGLSTADRIVAAQCHYLHQDRDYQPEYATQVYTSAGLTVWEQVVKGVCYDIRLMPGNDVAYEGGLSLVLHVDGGRVCVISFSLVPTRILLPDPRPDLAQDLPAALLFVTRKQLTQVRDYQAAFNKAFDRCTPGHMCFGALAGMARAQGHLFAFGIAAERHPSFIPDMATQFQTAYNQFWLSVSGKKLSDLGYLIGLPMQLPPLELLEPTRRKRATVRRGHIAEIAQAALDTIGPLLRQSGARAD